MAAEGQAAETQPLIVDQIMVAVTDWGMRVVAALIIFIIGMWLAKRIRGLLSMLMEKKGLEETLRAFFSNFAYYGMVAFVIIAAVHKLGVETTSLAAVFAAAGLAVGLALQGSLSNFASGVLIIAFKPFKAGDFVSAAGEGGFVVEVSMLTTELRTPDNVCVILPNSTVMSSAIKNFSAHATRRVDLVIGVSYTDDLKRAKEIIAEVIDADERALKDPAPQVAVSNLGDSSVDFVVRPWCKAADYWDFRFDVTQAIKERFDAEGISIPFPQRDVHLIQETAS
ncbi:mechanosensitive ion channel family protein [Coraliomargarita akajimensis]|uniref:MscS Mechanosensitive ion channel n=1 Tax=Coraliomargarita akajimensis (strain DSM 45221 / IAM 15411 / JCM 23193 / KCTC 12865 / 04OKA010-24) TaxID=583355 RepID=D5EI98_CORAD|nr:mechanosensitive ion channel domain-containing protein [Coraliomargarita akajimensis]ADE54164.1 MscS Mechanosensitive ion channel [Coraliomargarita akajimensis DSM 45221]